MGGGLLRWETDPAAIDMTWTRVHNIQKRTGARHQTLIRGSGSGPDNTEIVTKQASIHQAV